MSVPQAQQQSKMVLAVRDEPTLVDSEHERGRFGRRQLGAGLTLDLVNEKPVYQRWRKTSLELRRPGAQIQMCSHTPRGAG